MSDQEQLSPAAADEATRDADIDRDERMNDAYDRQPADGDDSERNGNGDDNDRRSRSRSRDRYNDDPRRRSASRNRSRSPSRSRPHRDDDDRRSRSRGVDVRDRDDWRQRREPGGGDDRDQRGGHGRGGGGRQASASLDVGAERIPPRRPPTAPANVEPSTVLGVFGLSIRTDQPQLEDLFAQYGRVVKAIIVFDQRTARSRGFGFVTMSTVEEATECIERLNGLELNGRRMRVDYSTTHRPHDPTPGAYMGEKRPGFDDRVGGGGGGRGPPPSRYGPGPDLYRGGGGGGGYDRYAPPPSRYDDRPRSRYDERDRRDRDYRRSPPPRRYRDDDYHGSRSRYSASPSRGGDDRDPRASSAARPYDDTAPAAGDRY